MTIRVLIADASELACEGLSRRVAAEGDMSVVGVVNDGETAVEMIAATHPDVVILSPQMPGLDGMDVASTISQNPEFAATGIILVATETEEQIFLRQATGVGANAFLSKPVRGRELVESIRRSHQLVIRRLGPGAAAVGDTYTKEGSVVAVYSGSGGVGTSVITANLGAALADHGRLKVVLVDLSLQYPDLSAVLAIDADEGRNIAAVAEAGAVDDDDFVERNLSTAQQTSVRLLQGPFRVETAEMVTADHVRGIMATLRRSFDFVIADCGHYLTHPVVEALASADQVVVVTGLQITSVKNTLQALGILEALRIEGNRIHLVANWREPYVDGQMLTAEEASRFCRRPMAAEIPHDPDTVRRSVHVGQPFVRAAPGAPASKHVLDLANRIAPHFAPPQLAPTVATAQRRGRLRIPFVGGR